MSIYLIGILPLLFFETVYGKCKTAKHQFDSRAYFEQGDILWNATKFEDSIHFYRAAVRLCPEEAQYWWKLGLAEWGSKLYGKAKSRFDEASRKGFENSSEFLYPSDFEEHLSNQDLPSTSNSNRVLNSEKLPSLLEKESLDWRTIGEDEIPFVKRSFLSDSVLFSLRSTQHQYQQANSSIILSYLLEKYALYPTEFYPQNMRERPSRVFNKPLQEALEFFDYPEGAYTAVDISLPGTYIQLNLNLSSLQRLCEDLLQINFTASSLKNDLNSYLQFLLYQSSTADRRIYSPEIEAFTSLPAETPVDLSRNIFDLFRAKSHWYMMLIGEEGSGMFHHVDNLPVASWQIQLEGEKHWILCSERSRPEEERECFQVVLQPGDLLFYPKYYSHETICLSTPSISVSGSLIPARDYQQFTSFLCQECEGNLHGYQLPYRFCNLVEEVCDLSGPKDL